MFTILAKAKDDPCQIGCFNFLSHGPTPRCFWRPSTVQYTTDCLGQCIRVRLAHMPAKHLYLNFFICVALDSVLIIRW